MKCIVGLGNPGAKYSQTRHNIGFMVLDEIARRWNIDNWRERFRGQIAELPRPQTGTVLLLRPLTFMNRSGESLQPAVQWYKLAPEDILIVHDDLDLEYGTIRLRTGGSAGGHNGIRSIQQMLPGQNFHRARLGVGRPQRSEAVVSHVLSPFSAQEREQLSEYIQAAADALETWLDQGLDPAMNRHNGPAIQNGEHRP